jgi:hypothetical protein
VLVGCCVIFGLNDGEKLVAEWSSLVGDAEKLVSWLHEAAIELEAAHLLLDEYNVPRGRPESDGIEMTLAARIYYALSEGVCD